MLERIEQLKLCQLCAKPIEVNDHIIISTDGMRHKSCFERRTPNLRRKIFRISREAGAVERKGVAENNGNESRPLYAYPRIEDVLDVVQPLLNKYKLIATGSVVKEPVSHVIRGGTATTEILVEWTLEDSETGESRTWRIPGSGSDDNGKGSYRSLTGSRKYFYVIVFNLKFGDEPEEVQRPKPEEQAT